MVIKKYQDPKYKKLYLEKSRQRPKKDGNHCCLKVHLHKKYQVRIQLSQNRIKAPRKSPKPLWNPSRGKTHLDQGPLHQNHYLNAEVLSQMIMSSLSNLIIQDPHHQVHPKKSRSQNPPKNLSHLSVGSAQGLFHPPIKHGPNQSLLVAEKGLYRL